MAEGNYFFTGGPKKPESKYNTPQALDDAIKNTPGYVLVKFGGDNCGPCIGLDNRMKGVVDGITYITMNIDKSSKNMKIFENSKMVDLDKMKKDGKIIQTPNGYGVPVWILFYNGERVMDSKSSQNQLAAYLKEKGIILKPPGNAKNIDVTGGPKLTN